MEYSGTTVSTDQVQNIKFVSDGGAPTSDALSSEYDLSPGYIAMTADEGREHTVKDFLQRPIKIANGVWSSTDTENKLLWSANFPETFILNNMIREKLAGFVGLRAKMHLKLQVNSMPFQSGILLLHYIPYAQYISERVDWINTTLTGKTGCPRTKLNLDSDTEMTLDIPYVSPHVFYNLITGQGSFGSAYLSVYAPTRSDATASSVDWTLWASMSDIEIQFSTGAPVYLGNAPNYVPLIREIESGVGTEETLLAKVKELKNQITPEAMSSHVFAQMSEIKILKNNASPSTGVGQISTGLKTLSNIPILGNFLSKPAWLSGKLADLLKLFGMSKPTTQGLIEEHKIRTAPRMANFDGCDSSHKLGLSSINELETPKGIGGSDKDDMIISRVVMTPNFIQSFNWGSTAQYPPGTVLYEDFVSPIRVKQESVKGIYSMPHCSFVAQTFGQWRGSLIYSFDFAKTKFHSGRLLITYTPYSYPGDNIANVDLNKSIRMIVDISSKNTVQFTVPFVCSRPWLQCIEPRTATTKYDCSTGRIRVEVLNQLRNGGGSSNFIDVLVELSGGSDLEFSKPAMPLYPVYEGSITRVHAQMQLTNNSISRNEAQEGKTPPTVNAMAISTNWSPDAYCIGEKIVSIRQLIKRFGYVGGVNQVTKTFPLIVVQPYRNTLPYTIAGQEIKYRPSSYIDYFSTIYTFFRGGMRLKLIANPTETAETSSFRPLYAIRMLTQLNKEFLDVNFTNTTQSGNPIYSTASSGSLDQNGYSTVLVDPSLEGCIEVEVPYYNISHLTPIKRYGSLTAIRKEEFSKGNLPTSVVTIRNQSSDVTNVTWALYRAAADDYSFFYIIGTGLFCLPTLKP